MARCLNICCGRLCSWKFMPQTRYCVRLWEVLTKRLIESGRGFSLMRYPIWRDLLWVLSVIFLCFCNIISKWCQCRIANAVSSLVWRYNLKILWRNRLKSDIGKTCLVTIDGTDFRIQNVKPFWRGWYSHKFHGPGIRYEVAICIQTGDIVWINGPFACGVFPDITIFRSGLIHELRRGEKVEADDGYRGEGDFISTPDDYENEEQHHEKDLARARHETGNGRFAVWNCLKYVFRHDVRKHSEIFRAVATITQLSIENGEPLFPVDYIYNN